MERTRIILGHVNRGASMIAAASSPSVVTSPVAGSNRPLPNLGVSDNDVVVVSALRTPICKSKRGGFKDTLPDDLLAAVFQAVIKNAGIEPTLIQDICVGNVMQPGSAANSARMAQFMSNIPESVTLQTTNRFCSSGLQACATIAASIKAGYIDIGIGAGVESLTVNEMGRLPPGMVLNPRAIANEKAATVLIPMGASKAQAQGLFNDEIIPVHTQLIDKDGNESKVVISKDDGVRAETTFEGLSKLKPVFQKDGSTTAGNASQTSDGAAAVILARRSFAAKHHLPVLGVFRSFAVVGVPPEVMGIGPAYAIPEALKKAGLTLDDIDVFEINEAFASQAVYCVEKLGIPIDKVNPKGGAIAFGHPLGCTGARQVATLLHELKRRQKRSFGVISMCIGTGMGAAAVFEYPSA